MMKANSWRGHNINPPPSPSQALASCPSRRKTKPEEELFVSKLKGRKCRIPKKIRPAHRSQKSAFKSVDSDQIQIGTRNSGLGNSDIFNWAREIITLAKETDMVYKMALGKRRSRPGIVNDFGDSFSEVFIQRAQGGKCYWKLADNISSSEDAQKERDRAKL